MAQDDEAERWISSLMGAASEGPAGLLWVRQGVVGLEPGGTKEKTQLTETRRDLLSSVAGEIDAMTGGRRMDRVMRRVTESLGEITTRTGRKAGIWKASADEIDSLEAELASVIPQVQTLDKALSDRKQAEASLRRLDNADAKARRAKALTAEKTAMEEARAHVGIVASVRQECDLVALKTKSTQSELDAFLRAIESLQTAEKLAKDTSASAEEAHLEALRLKAVLEAEQGRHKTAVVVVSAARKQLDLTHRQTAARKSKVEVAQLDRQITKANNALGERDAARALVKASGATQEWLRRVEETHAEIAELRAAVTAQATTLSMQYEGAVRVAHEGAIVPADHPITLDSETCLDLPGIGKMTIFAQVFDKDSKARLLNAESVRDELLSQVRAASLIDARALVATRAKAETKADLAQAVLDTLAPNGNEALHAAKADADLAAQGANDDMLPAIVDLETHLAQAEEAEDALRVRLSSVDAEHALARETSVKQQAAADVAQHALGQAKTDVGSEDTRDSRRMEHLRLQALGQDALTKIEARLQTLIAAAPDQDTAAAELERAENAVNAAHQERTQVGERLAALSAEIRTLAGNGIEEHLAELQGQVEATRATEARLARQAAALTRLQTALNTERDAARDTYSGHRENSIKIFAVT